MRTLAEINEERKELICDAMDKIVERHERHRRYSPAELSKMCDGLISPETFRKSGARAEYLARKRRKEWCLLFGWWNLSFKAYPVIRNYSVKWFDKDGQVVKTSEQYLADYEIEFI